MAISADQYVAGLLAVPKTLSHFVKTKIMESFYDLKVRIAPINKFRLGFLS